jgi:hypothetical protein
VFEIGDIVELYAATAGRDKYHLCIQIGTEGSAFQFLFLNSNPDRAGVFTVPCNRVPCLPESKTGTTSFSFNMVPRYSEAQLKLYRAKKMGVLDPGLAAEMVEFAKYAKGLTSSERKAVVAALVFIYENNAC